MSKFYTYEAWEQTFKPMPNSIRNNGDLQYETYGEEMEFIRNTDQKVIWTEVDGDSGTYIVAGYHYVNRIQYYITEIPWEDEYTEVPTWVYRDCACIDLEVNGILTFNGDPNPDCSECLGDGTIDIDCDTVVALKDIYGEDAPIVG